MTWAFLPHSVKLTLGELRTTTCFTQTDFLTLNATGVAGHVTGLAQSRTQSLIKKALAEQSEETSKEFNKIKKMLGKRGKGLIKFR